MEQYFDGPANPATNIPSSPVKESERSEIVPGATKNETDSSDEEEPQLEGDVENSEEDEPENANELRRRRLEALQGLDLD